ncbi:MAG: hypothetical protein ACYSYL_18325 [Planctomycetota bacterium]|jgi:hypothetical protein
MRTLFIPLAKLLGIYEVFRAFFYLQIIAPGAILKGKINDALAISFSIQVIFLILALILVFKAEKIADILKIPQDKTDSPVFDFHSMLRAGLVLLGIAIFVQAIPVLIGSALVLIPVPEKEMGHVYARFYQQPGLLRLPIYCSHRFRPLWCTPSCCRP